MIASHILTVRSVQLCEHGRQGEPSRSVNIFLLCAIYGGISTAGESEKGFSYIFLSIYF